MSRLTSGVAVAGTAGRRFAAAGPTRLAPIALACALGLLLCSVADALSRAALGPPSIIYWAGLALIAAPVLFRLCSTEASAGERLALVVLFGLALYAVKVVRDPFVFTFSDEPIHGYNADRIASAHHLFNGNPILPVTSSYPGLGAATSAVMSLTGMSSFGAGVLLVGFARVTFMIALFVLFHRMSGSARLAGLGAAIYAGNSNFLYWEAQYAYESLALPLMVVVLAAYAERDVGSRSWWGPWAVPMVLGILAVVVTHHLTSYALLIVLAALALVYRLRRLGKPNPWPFAAFALVVVVVWLVVVASSTVGYLTPVLKNAFSSTINTASGEAAPRTLFHTSSGAGAAPVLGRLVALAAVALLAAGFLLGLRDAWRRQRLQPLVLLFCLAGAGFFGALALRFAPAAWETGNRAGEFLFIGLSFVVAYGVALALRTGPRLELRRVGLTAALTVVVIGGVISGWPWDAQLAQPLRISAEGHDVESEPLALSRWVSRNLPEGRFGAAAADARLLLAPGEASAKTGASLSIGNILTEPSLSNWELPLLRSHHVRYLVADRRRVANDNVRGYFFAVRGSGNNGLIPLPAMHKFAAIPAARIYSSGYISVYDLGNRR